MITPQVADFVHEQGTAFVATVNEDGTPNLSPKGSISVVDETHLAFVDLRSPGTVRNVARRPAVEIDVVDPVRRRGYRFRGHGRVLTTGAEFDAVAAHYARRGFDRPIRSVVLIDVSAVLPVVSPAYDDGTSEEEIVARWAPRLRASASGPAEAHHQPRTEDDVPAARAAGDDDPAARNVATVRRLFDAVERRDAGALARAFHEDVVVHEAPSLPYGGEYRGARGIARQVAGYLSAWDRLQDADDRRLEPEFIAGGDRVVVLWRQRAHAAASGERFDMPAASVYRLRDERVVESRMFHFDTAAAAGFLDRAHGVDVAVAEATLNLLVERGAFVEALECFYADDVVMQEVGGPTTSGKAANRTREAMLFAALARIEGRLLGAAVEGTTSYSEWEYRLSFRSGRTLTYRQVAARQWRDGRVSRELFYHEPFPGWMADEIRITAQAGSGSRAAS